MKPAAQEKNVSPLEPGPQDLVDAALRKSCRNPLTDGEGVETPQGPGVNVLAALPVCLGVGFLLVILSFFAVQQATARQAPSGPITGWRQVGEKVPEKLLAFWIRSFPGVQDLKVNPSTQTLSALATSLAQRPEVSQVVRVAVENQKNARTLVLDLRLKKPILPVRLANGSLRWVAHDGTLLDPRLQGPKRVPLLVGMEASPANFKEIVAAWPEIDRRVGAERFKMITCAGEKPGYANRPVIQLITREDKPLDWGPAGADRYGISVTQKVQKMENLLRCQNKNLQGLARLDVGFHKEFAVTP